IKRGGAGGQVIVWTARAENGAVILRVRNTGIGISEDEVAAVLEPLRQTPTRSGGAGIGLPLAKALAEANGASLRIDSTAGSGTLIEVTFPPERTAEEGAPDQYFGPGTTRDQLSAATSTVRMIYCAPCCSKMRATFKGPPRRAPTWLRYQLQQVPRNQRRPSSHSCQSSERCCRGSPLPGRRGAWPPSLVSCARVCRISIRPAPWPA